MMSRKSRKRSNELGKNNSINAKRKCENSENILWPEEDESFFSNSKLEDLMTNNGQSLFTSQTISSQNMEEDSLFSVSKLESTSQGSHKSHSAEIIEISLFSTTNLECLFSSQNSNSHFQNNNCDDSIFSSINLPNEASNPYLNNDQICIEGDDTLFSAINLDDMTKKESEDIFNNDFAEDIEIQNTQKFLDDVAFKVPDIPKQKQTHLANTSKSVLDIPHQGGTQYETREEICNRTMLSSLSRFIWDTQAFPEVETIPDDFPIMGNFYGLPDKVKPLIFAHKNIPNLYEWQDECLNLPAIRKRKNLIYALPTSGGKTLVAEILMLREVICRQKNVLFILPYVSIVQEKVSAMSPFAIALNFIVDEYTAGKGKCPPTARKKLKSIFIASIEKGSVLIDSLIEAKRADEIGLVVVDELHLIGEKGRGATLEALLAKVMFSNVNIQIVGMSATIGNLAEISSFLKADVYTRGFRPVELKEHIKCGRDILEINTDGKTLEEVFIFKRSVNFKYSNEVARSDPDHLAGLVTECAPANCCLIFCPTRKNCENVAVLLSRILPKAKFVEHRKSEKADLMDALDKVCGILSPILARTIPYGIAYHHSGLTTDERKFIETAYRFGVLSVICCTSTLAAGVNLPAKRVIIRAPYIGSEFMTLCRYKQMVGRAGRAGMGEAGESFLIINSRDNLRVGEMLFSPMDKAISSLDFQDGLGLQGLVLSAIGLNMAACRLDLYRLVDSTLLAVQADQLGISTEKIILDILREMFKNKVLQICATDKRNISDILTTQDVKNDTTSRNVSQSKDRRLFISKSTRFQLTTIGKAAFKAGIDYKRTYAIYDELKSAQKHLILTNYAHLLYLVVAFNSNANGDELFAANASILFREYPALDETTQSLFKVLEFTEAHVAKLGKTLSIQGPMELKLNRLFKVLILLDILNVLPLPTVAAKYDVERGMLQNLISQSTSAASAIVRLCEQLEEFWCYKGLFESISTRIDRCGTKELEALLELPAVKINRAKQLYAAGFKTIPDIAKCRPMELVRSVEHMPLKIAKEIISAAKIILMKKLDYLEEETEALKVCLQPYEA